MKIKTSELTEAALDWAVAKCEGLMLGKIAVDGVQHGFYSPSTKWEQGGPIIERNRIYVTPNSSNEGWRSYVLIGGGGIAWSYFGPTFLIAAMRCYVASKLGDEIEVPEML